MEHIENFGDERVTARCAYCGANTDTRDHVPPKVFLDEPLPENVHHVGACFTCNNGLSLDEEYIACLIECARLGTADSSSVERPKTRRILERSPALAARITASMKTSAAGVIFDVELPRAKRVFEKLARAHALYEENVATAGEPDALLVLPLHLLSPQEVQRLETSSSPTVWPEVGSRALSRFVVAGSQTFSDWVEVQPDRYRFLTVSDPLTVRIVISEYLACEAVWL